MIVIIQRPSIAGKTEKEIRKLVEKGELDKLKAISQHCIQNAWYKVQFNPDNERGIHGTTPSEMLHAVLLGIYQYCRNTFFALIRKTGQLAKAIDTLASQYGERFGRQSDRDLPKTKFGSGIKKGKLMAKEYRGVLLVIAAVLRSTKGRALLSK